MVDEFSPEDDMPMDTEGQTTSLSDLAPAEAEESLHDKLLRWGDPRKVVNIADELDADKLAEIGMEAHEGMRIDDDSRGEWLRDGERGMELALQRAKAKNYPWPKASNIIWPMMTEAADQFAARCYSAIIKNRNVVKGKVVGADEGVPMIDPGTGVRLVNPQTKEPMWQEAPGSKVARSTRVSDHMSWQLLEEQTEWESDTDILIAVLPIIGCEFKKTYYDPVMGRNLSVRVSAKNLIINYWAKSLETAPRLSEVINLYPYEVEEMKRSGQFRDVDYGISENVASNDKQSPLTFIEQHCRLDLDGDGYPEPYIVTFNRQSMVVARIVARFDAEGLLVNADSEVTKIVPVHYYTKYDFLPSKEGGIYGIGFGTLLRPINEATNATINMLLDAGHQQVVGGGFIGKGLNLHKGEVKRRPGEWTPINAAGSTIRDAVVPIPHTGSSETLFKLLGFLIEAGKDISSVKDVLSGDIKAQTMSPTVFMALVEQGLQAFSSIFKRLHRAMQSEFDKLYRLNRLYLEESASYQINNEWKTVTRDDYKRGSGVQPVSDPTMVADAQRMAKTQVLEQFKDNPLVNGKEVLRRIFEASGQENVEKLFAGEPPPNPDLIVKMAELELRNAEVTARVVLTMAQAVKVLAEADATIQEPFQQWANLQLQNVRDNVDANAKLIKAGTNAAGGAGDPGGAVPNVEAPSGDGGAAALPV